MVSACKYFGLSIRVLQAVLGRSYAITDLCVSSAETDEIITSDQKAHRVERYHKYLSEFRPIYFRSSLYWRVSENRNNSKV